MTFRYLKIILVVLVGVALLFFVVQAGGASLVHNLAGTPQVGDSGATTGDTTLLHARAPYFDLPNGAGEHVALSKFSDTPLVVVFWSTWNAEAADQIHIIDGYLGKRSEAEQLVPVVAINSQEEPSVVASFMRRGGYQVQTLMDVQGLTSEQYRIKSLPTFYFIGRDGTVDSIYTGVLSEAMLINKVEALLN